VFAIRVVPNKLLHNLSPVRRSRILAVAKNVFSYTSSRICLSLIVYVSLSLRFECEFEWDLSFKSFVFSLSLSVSISYITTVITL